MSRSARIMALVLFFLLWGSAAAVHSFNPIYRGPNDFDPIPTISLEDFTGQTSPTAVPLEGIAAYEAGLALFSEERFYSAQKAFTASNYGDWEEWAALCIREKPETGEIWHDPDQTDGDTQLTIRAEQEDTDLFVRIYKEDSLISDVYIAGSDRVTIKLPGDTAYSIRNGVGRTWYGEKEAFGEEGSYEPVIFDGKGTEEILLKSGLAYELRINIGYRPDSEPETRDSFSN